ncbi:MAG: hypothetical protein SGI77_07105 [Pirellulaceae bacterium]|nr:hypothetical protein [Pirellulaceae bacterium]
MALTATATPAVLDDIRAGFSIAKDDVVQTPFHRKNLRRRDDCLWDGDRQVQHSVHLSLEHFQRL